MYVSGVSFSAGSTLITLTSRMVIFVIALLVHSSIWFLTFSFSFGTIVPVSVPSTPTQPAVGVQGSLMISFVSDMHQKVRTAAESEVSPVRVPASVRLEARLHGSLSLKDPCWRALFEHVENQLRMAWETQFPIPGMYERILVPKIKTYIRNRYTNSSAEVCQGFFQLRVSCCCCASVCLRSLCSTGGIEH